MSDWTAEQVAELFHLNYERLAPSHGYETREATAVPWSEVKDPNRGLMIEVAGDVLAAITPASNEGECPHIVTSDEGTEPDPEPFYAIRLATGGASGDDLIYGEYAWMSCDGPDDWTVPENSEHDDPTTYEIVNMRPVVVATRTFGEWDLDDDDPAADRGAAE